MIPDGRSLRSLTANGMCNMPPPPFYRPQPSPYQPFFCSMGGGGGVRKGEVARICLFVARNSSCGRVACYLDVPSARDKKLFAVFCRCSTRTHKSRNVSVSFPRCGTRVPYSTGVIPLSLLLIFFLLLFSVNSTQRVSSAIFCARTAWAVFDPLLHTMCGTLGNISLRSMPQLQSRPEVFEY